MSKKLAVVVLTTISLPLKYKSAEVNGLESRFRSSKVVTGQLKLFELKSADISELRMV